MASYRILIVEDQREVSRLLHTSLDTLEHKLEVIEIFSGEEVILDASRNTVDLLVTDYRLPGISGIELMRKVKQYRPDVKVILITGLTDPKVRKEVAEAGADSFFIKPVPIADFLDAVERHLGLVKTLLPPEPIAKPEIEIKEQRGLSDLLVGLRQELDAQAVLVLDAQGRVVAQAGALPDASIETNLVDWLMAMSSASQKVSRLIGQKSPSNWHIFDGKSFDLFFTPVGTNHAILVTGERLASEETIVDTVERFMGSRGAIEEALGVVSTAMAEPHAMAAEETESEPEEKTPEIDALFKSKKKIKPAEADAFWTDASEKHKPVPTKPDVLTYEQARQLGLAPQDET